MTPPTTTRNLLGHFLHGADPLATNQRDSPPTVRSSTSSPLWEISAAGARGGGTWGGAGGYRCPRDDGVGETDQGEGLGTVEGS